MPHWGQAGQAKQRSRHEEADPKRRPSWKAGFIEDCDAPLPNLQHLRTARGLSQAELAAAAGVAASHYAEIEAGRQRPRGQDLMCLATALRVPLRELFRPPGTTAEQGWCDDLSELEELLGLPSQHAPPCVDGAALREHLVPLVRLALQRELITLSRAAELLRVGTREMRSIAASWAR